MTKASRQNTIMNVIQQGQISSQNDLRKRLARTGFRVTQATLSRDVHELGLVKGPDGYQFPIGGPAPLAVEQVLPSAHRLVREFALEIHEAQNQVVIKTAVGSAGPVAASLDGQAWPEVIGTIAGDDTILIVTKDERAARMLAGRIRELLD